MNIQEILAACKQQDRMAQKTLYNLYVKLLLFVAMRYVGDVHAAKDIVQETMLRFFRSVARLDFAHKKALDAYLRQTTVNEALRWINKNQNVEFLDPTKYTRKVQYNEGESAMLKNALLQDIKSLPVGYRIIFNMYAIEGYSHKEIAEKLNIKESTSRSQLTRARLILQKKILNRANYVKGI